MKMKTQVTNEINFVNTSTSFFGPDEGEQPGKAGMKRTPYNKSRVNKTGQKNIDSK